MVVTFLELSMMQTARRAHVPEVHRPHPDRPGDSHILPFQVSKVKQSASLFITLCGPRTAFAPAHVQPTFLTPL